MSVSDLILVRMVRDARTPTDLTCVTARLDTLADIVRLIRMIVIQVRPFLSRIVIICSFISCSQIPIAKYIKNLDPVKIFNWLKWFCICSMVF